MLPDLHEIRTADNVGIGYDAAGIGSRFLAFAIDSVIQGVVILAALVVALAIAPEGVAGSVAIALFVLVPLLVAVGYYTVAEALTAGRTPGKRALGLRVIRLDGGAPGLTEALVRNIVRLLDMPGFGLVAMFLDRRSRRLGDLAAGTVVVRERRASAAVAPVLPPPMLRTPDAGPAIEGVDRLGPAEWSALRTFLSRQGLHPEQRARLAEVIAARLCERLELDTTAPERQWPAELLLERLYLQLEPRMAPAPAQPGPGMPV
ncbi:MAG TPA: RDD family protein [Candidatus Dormibacteraeota bacterium]|nr:RDD family protein [Candidatus Dormibacteraeota bacterium]